VRTVKINLDLSVPSATGLVRADHLDSLGQKARIRIAHLGSYALAFRLLAHHQGGVQAATARRDRGAGLDRFTNKSASGPDTPFIPPPLELKRQAFTPEISGMGRRLVTDGALLWLLARFGNRGADACTQCVVRDVAIGSAPRHVRQDLGAVGHEEIGI
jgi:hypothetical protein